MFANGGLLLLGAATIGALHTAAPDHWMPFAALGRARGWTPLRTARTTILCGFGHVTVSALLGIISVFLGLGAVKLLGGHLETFATWMLMAFGVIYMIWGLHRSFRPAHDHHHHERGLTEWSLFLLFSADPCVAVIPMIVAAAGEGWPAVIAVVVAYELATIGTMVILATAALVGAGVFRAPWLDRFGHAAAGALIAAVGVAMAVTGL
jgi:hypothetical protein